MQNTRKRAVVLGLSGLAAGALVLPAVASAADPTPSPSASSPSSPDPRGAGGHHGPGGGEMVGSLASELGVTEQRVRDALDAVRERLRDAGRPDDADREARRAAFAKALAAELGVSEERVTAALEKARSAAEADRTARLTEGLDAAVRDGKITQADADAVLRVAEAGVLGGVR
ncbi:MAG TPA: hypothetical protein VHI50_06260 [Micromonosporaceae bacterium]|nr:hypothetical protein [Micromonosporaceae bacterium]